VCHSLKATLEFILKILSNQIIASGKNKKTAPKKAVFLQETIKRTSISCF